MANENMIKFLRGNVANLPQTATAGALYFTKDEGIYLGMEDGSYHRYGDFITVANVNALPATGAHATCMYYCAEENILARYDAAKGWIQINKQPTAEEMKTLLGLGDLAYLDEVAEANLAEALATKINNKVDKADGKSLVADTEIARLAAMSDGANKVEASETNGKIKIDGVETTVYTHPEKHAIADVDGLQGVLDGKVDKVDGKGLSTNDLTDELKGQYDAAYAHSQVAHAPADAQANIIESVKVNGTALEITDKAVDIAIPTGALAGKDKVAKTDLDEALANELDGKSVEGHTHVAEDITNLDDTIKAYGYATKAYVGDIPNDENGDPMAASVIAYINKKTDGIATSGNLEALGNRVGTAEGEIDTLQGDVAAIKDDADIDSFADVKTYIANEDKFEIDMVTVNAHGGVAAGEDLNGLTTHEILKKILYPYVQPVVGNATASPNGGTYEKGVTKTITQVSISVTKKSELITSVALYNGSTLIEEKTGDAVKDGGTITFSGLSIEVPTNGNQLTVKVTDAKGTVQEKKTTAMSFVYPYYMGTCAAGTAIDEALVESLTKKVEGKGNKSNSFTVSDGHMVFAYPKAHGVLNSILDPNNFETIGNYTRSEVSVTGLDETAQTYYVYVSGATTVSGFAVNFKY